MTGGGSSIHEIQRLLAVLAVGRRVAEAGTAFGDGGDGTNCEERRHGRARPRRAAIAARRLEGLPNVELLLGDWRELLPPRGRFELLFLDAGGFKHAPGDGDQLVLGLLEPGGLLVLDDLTPDWPGFDPVRNWAHGHSDLEVVEVLTTPVTSALLIAKPS